MKNLPIITKSQRIRLSRWTALIGVLSLLVCSYPINNAFAVGTLSTPRVYLSRQIADLASGLQLEVFFTTVSAVSSGGKVVIIFPSGANHNTKWCRTTGSDLVATGITNPTGATESASALTSSSSFSTACSQTPDTITISNVAALSGTTKYGVRIAQAGSPTALLGTTSAAANDIQVTVKTQTGASADVDSGTVALSIISNDQVAVSATVNPTLTVVLSANTASLGTLDTGHINQAGITSQVTTNGANGYASLVNYNATLTSGSNTIQNVPGSTLAIGNEGYGASSSQSGNTIAQWNPTSCATTTSTTNLTALSTSFQSFASASAPVSAQTTTLCFGAGVSGTTKAGSYTSTSTLVTTGKF